MAHYGENPTARKKKIDGVMNGLVKWLGYNNRFNEWKPMSEIKKLI